MPSSTETSVVKFGRLVGLPDAPVGLDVRIDEHLDEHFDEHFDADPRVIHDAFHRRRREANAETPHRPLPRTVP